MAAAVTGQGRNGRSNAARGFSEGSGDGKIIGK